MDQLSLFAVSNDTSNVSFWTAQDFANLLRQGQTEPFQNAMRSRGVVDTEVLEALLQAPLTEVEQYIKVALDWQDRTVQPFVWGDSEANTNNELFQTAVQAKDKTDLDRFVRLVLKARLRQWVGEKLWIRTPFAYTWDSLAWPKKLSNTCAFLDRVIESKAIPLAADQIQMGDVVLTSNDYQIFEGVVVDSKITHYVNGSSSATVFLWIPESQRFFSSLYEKMFVDWVSHHPTLAELVHRRVERVWSTEFYCVGHRDDVPSLHVSDETVYRSFKNLPQPETPEAFWDWMSWGRNDWLYHFHRDVHGKALFFHMSRFGLEQVERVLATERIPRRGSYHDHLPADETIAPMVNDLVAADTVEEVQAALDRYWWIKRWHSARGWENTIYRLERDFSCYDGLFKAGLAQSQDQKFITKILQVFALNGQLRYGDIRWTEHGLEISDDPTDPKVASQLLDELQNGVCLGIFTGYDAVASQAEVFEDDDEEFECSSCDVEEGE